ncbi:MAG TPA: DUF5666 domain-containing protein [Thermoanaerobaculia bacterium]|nr:DUF5666 domain-containing protein [Thermoanaerobaculia bacterium]
MPRKLLVLFTLALLASTATARTRSVSHPTPKSNAATVHGVITSVTGSIVAIGDGLITVDAAEAQIVVGRKNDATVADLKPGMLLFAAVRGPFEANAPLQATMITATHIADATLFGSVDAVDRTARTLTLLGRTIQITDDTSFGGILRNGAAGLDDVFPNQLVQVQTEVVNARLVASSVTIVAPVPPSIATLRGIVKSIGTNAWVIDREQDGDVTVQIDANTKIAGSPKVGDKVEVLYRIDSAHANIAIAIVRIDLPIPTLPTRLSGTVKTLGNPWVLTLEGGGEAKVYVDRAKIEPGIRTGDRVEVLAEKRDDGAYDALLIIRRRF